MAYVSTQIMLKLIDSFGPDHWPLSEIEALLQTSGDVHNKALRTNVQQVFLSCQPCRFSRS